MFVSSLLFPSIPVYSVPAAFPASSVWVTHSPPLYGARTNNASYLLENFKTTERYALYTLIFLYYVLIYFYEPCI